MKSGKKPILVMDPGSRQLGKFVSSCATALLLCFVISYQAKAQSITLDFGVVQNSTINFSGGNFYFVNSVNGDPNQFDITSQQGGIGDSVGLDGYISPGGPFTIGTISTPNGYPTAKVTGTGTLNIVDTESTPEALTGTINWMNISTVGVSGALDLMGTINLTGLTYSGNNSDLMQLASAGDATDVVTFQFTPAETLWQLQAANGLSTSYSGSISTVSEIMNTVPEPSALTLIPAGGLAFFALKRRFRQV